LLVADDGDDSVGDEAVAAGSADEIFEGEDEEDDWKQFGRDAEVADDRYLWCRRVFQMMSERSDALGDNYPFVIDNQTMSIQRLDRTDGRLLYVFYLACTSLSFVSGTTMQALTSHFEAVSAEVLRSMLPPPFEIDLYGTARGLGSSRFTGVPFKRIEQLSRATHGFVSCDPGDFHPMDRADNGLDLVAWLPMEDAGKGAPSYFCQCACGDKWEGKQYEAGYDRWKEFIALTSPPTKVTFIPHYFRRLGEDWWAPGDVSGVVIDRLRAMRFASDSVVAKVPQALALSAWDYRLPAV
jgi:hypothetical protein